MDNQISNEVRAIEAHEKAVGYYRVSERYGYKFLMELKKIRDEKLFVDLGFNNFEEYTLSSFNYSKRSINERIQTAEVFEKDFERTSARFGIFKTVELAQLPETERGKVMEIGLQTE